MEHSSPLAAMQPPSLRWGDWSARDVPASYSQLAASKRFAPDNFNLRDINMRASPVRGSIQGSSPAASLAVDISQNFHIDKSPQFPTPRRALFSSNLFASMNGRENMTTPPIPSSSPSIGSDAMDITPLPHKPAFNLANAQASSPTPQQSSDMEMSSSPDPLIDSPSDHVKGSSFMDRRKVHMLRPSLGKKSLSSGVAATLRSNGLESDLSPFRFGNAGLVPESGPMSLSEAFTASPKHDKSLVRNHSGHLYTGPRLRPPFGASIPRNCASPSSSHIRKPSALMPRPRKHIRRALSMFESAEDMIKTGERNQSSTLQSIMDIEEQHVPQLPHYLLEDQSDNIPRITKETLCKVLDGEYGELYDHHIIIDCRFEYEYEGGHIEDAENFTDKDELAQRLFDTPPQEKTLLVLHCEYSAHRAPIMARFVRAKDRKLNTDYYPRLTYPEMYVLEGGYRSFYNDHRSRCYPQNYVEMDDAAHASACERGLNKVKQHRSKLSRAQTYAFGQQSPGIEDSPTTLAALHNHRHDLSHFMPLDFTSDNYFSPRRQPSQRSISY